MDASSHIDGASRPGVLLRRAVVVAVCAMAMLILGPLVTDAAAKPRVSTLYGVTGQRQLHASVRVTAAPLKARAVLHSRILSNRRTRSSARIVAGKVHLRWSVPASLGGSSETASETRQPRWPLSSRLGRSHAP